MSTIEIKAGANVKLNDLASAIAELEPYEINDFFLSVVERQGEPETALKCSENLKWHYDRLIGGK